MIPVYSLSLFYSITFFVGLVSYKSSLKQSSKLFLLIVLFGFFVELQGALSYYIFEHNSRIGYNIYKIISLACYFLFFYRNVKDFTRKKLVLTIGLLYLFYTVFHYVFIFQTISKFNIHVSLIGAFSLISVIIIYLVDVLNSDKILNLKSLLPFWVSVGNILFFIGYLPVFVLSSRLGFNYVYSIIIFVLNVLMQVCFIVGFIRSKKELKR